MEKREASEVALVAAYAPQRNASAPGARARRSPSPAGIASRPGAPRRVVGPQRAGSRPGSRAQSRPNTPPDEPSSELRRLAPSPIRPAAKASLRNNIGTARAPRPGNDETPLWEWCHKEYQNPSTSRSLSAGDWGVYSLDQNAAIEASFMAKEGHSSVEVGIRTFQIEFMPKDHGYAWQKDKSLNKSRLARRRLVSSDAFEAAMQPALPAVALDQDECAICCISFAESAAMPIIELPGCQHAFHEACALQLRDRNEGCPCCRGEVDWENVLPKQTTPRGWKSCRRPAEKKENRREAAAR